MNPHPFYPLKILCIFLDLLNEKDQASATTQLPIQRGFAKHGEFSEKSGKINYQVNLTSQTPFVNLNPLSRNPGSVPVQSNKSRLFMHLLSRNSGSFPVQSNKSRLFMHLLKMHVPYTFSFKFTIPFQVFRSISQTSL